MAILFRSRTPPSAISGPIGVLPVTFPSVAPGSPLVYRSSVSPSAATNLSVLEIPISTWTVFVRDAIMKLLYWPVCTPLTMISLSGWLYKGSSGINGTMTKPSAPLCTKSNPWSKNWPIKVNNPLKGRGLVLAVNGERSPSGVAEGSFWTANFLAASVV